MEYESDCGTNCNRCALNNPQKIGARTRRLRIQRTSRNHLDYSIIKIGQNTEGESWKLEETCCLSHSSKKPLANAGVKNSQGVPIICKRLQLQLTILKTNYLHTVIWLQLFPCNSDNLLTNIWFQITISIY